MRDEAAQVDCPTCGTPIVLLPLKAYTGTEKLDPNEVFDVVAHSRETMFAIVDAEGCYTCPQCRESQRVGDSDADERT